MILGLFRLVIWDHFVFDLEKFLCLSSLSEFNKTFPFVELIKMHL